MSIDHAITELVRMIRRDTAAAHGLLLPVSGGTDGALCFALCTLAHNNVLGVFVGNNLRQSAWFENIGLMRYLPADTTWEDPEIMRLAHFQMLAKKENRWLVGSRTATEQMLGTYSLASRAATYLPIAGLWKSEVMALCQALNVPKEIMDSSRRADPACGRPPEMAEISLERVDILLRLGETSSSEVLAALTKQQLDYLQDLQGRNNFKRALPKVGTRVPVLSRQELLKRAGVKIRRQRSKK